MIKRHINLKTTRLKQARKQAFSKKANFSLRKKVGQADQNIRQSHPSNYNSYFLNAELLMNQFRKETVSDWAAIRILDFLNRARKIEDLTAVKQPENIENQYSIGATVAQRILDYRQRLAPFRRFTALSQLEHIEGFGLDKFNDLIRLLAMRADDAFRASMYKDILFDNWSLNYHRFEVENIQAISTSESDLKALLGAKVEELSFAKDRNRTLARLAKKTVQLAYLEEFHTQEYAAIALAFWLYKVDMDNWFSLERVLEKTRHYVAHYDRSEHRIELRLLKGFPNDTILVNALTTDDLPVIINHAEKSVSIWTVGLND